ncbi:tRNA uridine(34) 5-carboxymethylaminomethyl modification radical SAM/GNAT enzyme Elp3 [Candidatus Micrarchaeota archaeon]|nr:tRNA uridine(34) 5-carboxymethylaminomethyl modification radical SAM/GNAT enzyme Elp3 [Candidatus Micrarchaeota archaeon]MBU1166280.1 tRNA uridine(34) 5-carboxymethylaminomethyl modification radical SAM/GNAT enzyme Elp3 [Candidatus Micrarchaeota archaeon]MBU1886727.1 tRNA uridine(34) 5-carboxymethylaminomethyl modification radical SAM/GNAT enzyme Elp3 [Candidatus Micrarchaeota archaeon]
MDKQKSESIDYIIDRLIAGERNLDWLKRKACKKFGVNLAKNPEILEQFPRSKLTPEIKLMLLKKPTKTISGVTPIAVMIKPIGSCNQQCIYCPYTGLAAKSYVGFEPAALRARQYHFDPYLQALKRVEQIESAGHASDKCEVIIMGGTFLQMPRKYKRSFIKGVYDALNGEKSRTLKDAIKINETTKRRVVGLTIETRPDVCIHYIDEILSYGATRVELGVQHPNDSIYKLIHRGHTVQDVKNATKELKDSAFKVLYHIMPGLPGSDRKKDMAIVKRLFSDQAFKPDMLKIYPTLVIDGTELHNMLQRGEYMPYSTEEAADIISEFYRYIPKYVRVMRIQRDIPASKINSGVKNSNLRELVEHQIREKGIVPQEIRYREIRKRAGLSGFELKRLDYNANNGKEIFLSYENDDELIAGFLRLRLPEESNRKEINGKTALIRELHIYGPEIPLKVRNFDGTTNNKANGSDDNHAQHHGLGSNLLKEAEDIAIDAGKENMVIISGVGVREYYRKHGYVNCGPYVSKKLD